MGYLDDARYARTFAEDRRALDAWGPERIERRLLELGVDREHVAAAIGERDGEAELDGGGRAAAPPLSARCRRTSASASGRSGMLVRKGYDLELAYDAVRAFERAERDLSGASCAGGLSRAASAPRRHARPLARSPRSRCSHRVRAAPSRGRCRRGCQRPRFAMAIAALAHRARRARSR